MEEAHLEYQQRDKGRRPADHWRIERGVPVALLVTILVQSVLFFGGGAYWVFSVNASMGRLAENQTDMKIKLDAFGIRMDNYIAPMALYGARLDNLERDVRDNRQRLESITAEQTRRTQFFNSQGFSARSAAR